jgi:hypothetical protein
VSFGLTSSTFSRNLWEAEKALYKALHHVPEAHVCWPTKEQQQQWAHLVELKEPLVKNCFGFIDGKNYNVMQPTAADLQNSFYNGWLHDVKITGKIFS